LLIYRQIILNDERESHRTKKQLETDLIQKEELKRSEDKAKFEYENNLRRQTGLPEVPIPEYIPSNKSIRTNQTYEYHGIMPSQELWNELNQLRGIIYN
jgi:hypothetical protein